MTAILFHKTAHVAGYGRGCAGGVKPDGFVTKHPETYVVAQVDDMDDAEAKALFCEPAAPLHRREAHAAETRRHRLAMHEALVATRPHVDGHKAKAMAKFGLLGPMPKEIIGRVVKLKDGRVFKEVKNKRQIRAWKRSHDDIGDLFHQQKRRLEYAAHLSVGDIDRSKLIAPNEFPMRLRHVDLDKLPAPDERGVLKCDRATLLAATGEKEIA